jgi:phosphate starvation-inducible protein PhoH
MSRTPRTTQKTLNKLKLESLQEIEPLTDAQKSAYEEWDNGNNLILDGSAGTGKTFIAMHMAFEVALDHSSPYKRVVIVRSVVPTRQIGYLPGDEEEKTAVYMKPYIGLAKKLFEGPNPWEKLMAHNQVEFEITSFIRGDTWDDCIVIVDEMQNMSNHELDSVITRLGDNTRIIFSGDYFQTDFTREEEKSGLPKFLKIIKRMPSFSHIQFGWKDIVRSGLVREYIFAKEMAKKGLQA